METQTGQSSDVRWLLFKAEELLAIARKVTDYAEVRTDADAAIVAVQKAQASLENALL